MITDGGPVPPYLQTDDNVILFDGVCRLCSGWVRFVMKHDRKMRFSLCTVQSPEGQAILNWFGMPTETFDTLLLVEGATVYTRSDAFLRVVGHLSKPWFLLSAFKIVPRGLRDWCYDRIARNRYQLFGRYGQCRVPSGQDRKRFLGFRADPGP